MPSPKPTHLLQKAKLGALTVFGLLEMIYYAGLWPRFWWMRRRGRGAEVDAIVFRITEAWAARTLRRLGCVVELEGERHVPLQGALLVMCNHQSLFDIPVLMASLGRQAGFVAKRELFRLPGFSFWMRQVHSFSLDRASPRAAARLFDEAGRLMKETGTAIILFPEGTRSRDPGGRIGPFREGAVRLASEHDIPILPVSLDGTRYFRQPEHMHRTRKGGRVVRVRIAPPVMPRARNSPERRKLVERIRDTIVANHAAIRVEWPVRPPATRTVPRAGAAES